MNVFQALLDDLSVLIEAELLSRHYQVELGNEKKPKKLRMFQQPKRLARLKLRKVRLT